MTKIFVHPWNVGSKGARALAQALGGRRLKLEGSAYVPSPEKVVINWGASEFKVNIGNSRVLNHPGIISSVSNKRNFFNMMAGIVGGPRVPEFTTELEKALDWVQEGKLVVGRESLTSSGGAGIVFSDEDLDAFQKCKLWTVYKKKKQEYRVHIIGSEVVLVQRKALRTTDDAGQPIEKELVNFRVRNLANGFVFVRNDVTPPADVIEQARRAHSASKLDFGAYDVIYNDHENLAYVLEVNTAPGLEGTTIEDYAKGFRALLG